MLRRPVRGAAERLQRDVRSLWHVADPDSVSPRYETMGDPRPVEEVLEPGKNIPAGAVPFVPV